ncbi:MAG: hypothetical protein KKI02_08985, partial [Planctomycetes bacterium]|nr:hypothetical protein [Planctomycetota bacterium]
EEQVERLAAFRKSLSGGGPDKEGEAGSVRDVLRAVKRLKLDSKQKEGIREIEREAIRAYREIPRKDKQEHAALAREVKAEIIKVLDEDQVKEFEQQLTRPDRGLRGESDQQRERGERRDRGRRGEREP